MTNSSFRVSPDYLERIESGYLADMIAKSPAYEDYVKYPYDSATFALVDQAITNKVSKDGYLKKSGRDWQFTSVDSTSLDDLSDVSTTSLMDGVQELTNSGDKYSRPILRFVNGVAQPTVHSLSEDYFTQGTPISSTYTTDTREVWRSGDPVSYANGDDQLSYFRTLLAPHAMSTDWLYTNHALNDGDEKAVWINGWAQAWPFWSPQTGDQRAANIGGIKKMQAQEFGSRPIATWESLGTTRSVTSNWHQAVNPNAWNIRSSIADLTGLTTDWKTGLYEQSVVSFYLSGENGDGRGFNADESFKGLGMIEAHGDPTCLNPEDMLWMVNSDSDYYDINGITGSRLLIPTASSFWSDGTSQVWPDPTKSQFQTAGSAYDNYTVAGTDHRLAAGAARTKLDHIVPAVTEAYSDVYDAADYAFDEVTRRLDLLHEVADWSGMIDAGRLHSHPFVNAKDEYWTRGSDHYTLDKTSYMTTLGGDRDEYRNKLLPLGLHGIALADLDQTIAQDRGLLKKYNERKLGGMKSSAAGGSLFDVSAGLINRDALTAPTDDNGVGVRQGENMGSKAWARTTYDVSRNISNKVKVNDSTNPVNRLSWRDPHNFADNAGDWSIDSSWTPTMGSNISQLFVNWLRPFALPDGRTENFLDVPAVNTVTRHKASNNIVTGDSKWTHATRASYYVSMTLVWDEPQPSDLYEIVAFPGTPHEKLIPDPTDQWNALRRINGSTTDGWPDNESDVRNFFLKWGYPSNLNSFTWDDTGVQQSEEVFNLTDAIDQRTISVAELTSVGSLSAGYDWFGGESGDQPQKGRSIFYCGQALHTTQAYFYQYLTGAGTESTKKEIGGVVLPWAASSAGLRDKYLQHYKINTGGDFVDPRICVSDFYLNWDPDEYINHEPITSTYLQDDHGTFPSGSFNFRGRPVGVANQFVDWDEAKLWREPFLRTDPNTVLKSRDSDVNPNGTVSGKYQWTRVLSKDKYSCTLLVPYDWWTLQQQDSSVDFRVRYLHYGNPVVRGMAHPNFELPVNKPNGTYQQAGFFAADWEADYVPGASNSTWWPENYKVVSETGLVNKTHPEYNWRSTASGDIDLGSINWLTTDQLGSSYRHRVGQSYRSASSSEFVGGKNELMWYMPNADHWQNSYSYQPAFVSDDATMKQWASQVDLGNSIAVIGYPDQRTYGNASGNGHSDVEVRARRLFRPNDDGRPAIGTVSGLTFNKDIRFTSSIYMDNASYDVYSTPKGRDIRFLFGGYPSTDVADVDDTYNSRFLWNAPARTTPSDGAVIVSVDNVIDSDSIDPADWVIPAGTTITLPTPVPILVQPPKSGNDGQPTPYFGVAISSPLPMAVAISDGRSFPGFDLDIQPTLHGNDTDLIGVDASLIYEGSHTLPVTLDLDIKEGIYANPIPEADYGNAGEGWGYDPNDFGRHGTPMWEGQEADPWLDAEGLLDVDNQTNSGFGSADDVPTAGE